MTFSDSYRQDLSKMPKKIKIGLLRDQAKASGILGTEKLEIVINDHRKENPRRENWYQITGSNLTIPRENSHRANLRVTKEINSGRDSRMKALAHSI